MQKEHKTAQALDKAVHNHDVAVTNAKNAEKTEQVRAVFSLRASRRA